MADALVTGSESLAALGAWLGQAEAVHAEAVHLRPLDPGIDPDWLPGARPLAGGPLYFSRAAVILRARGTRRAAVAEITAIERFADDRSSVDPLAANALRNRLDALTVPRTPFAGLKPRLGSGAPLLMGVVNVTPDSFSDGGRFANPAMAIEHARSLLSAGADIVDIGGESTKPGATPVDPDEEIRRVLPVLHALAHSGASVSIDTRKARVMAAAVEAGAAVINDVSALAGDPDSLRAAAASRASIVLMHMQGTPETMQRAPHYDDVAFEVAGFLEARIAACVAAGIARERIAVDPGIGFGKTLDHNVTLLDELAMFHGLGVALAVGVSRKGFIGTLSGIAEPERRVSGSIAAALHAAARGAHVLRVHDVDETRAALAVWRGLRP